MFSNRDHVGASDFGNGDLLLVGGVEVNVVRADTSGDAELEVLSLLEDFSGSIARMERCADRDAA